MNKEQAIREVEIAFEVYELMKSLEHQSWHRVISLVEQINRDEQMKRDMAEKAAYSAFAQELNRVTREVLR